VSDKEASARIKINQLLEAAGWRFFADGDAPANIRLEPSVTLKTIDLDALGDNFEKTAKACIDFLLLDAKGIPLIVIERPRPRTRTHSSARSKPASTPARRPAASSSCRTATCTTSGISNAATHMSLPRSRRRIR